MFSVAVVGKGFDGNAATRIEQANDLYVFGIHQLDQVLHLGPWFLKPMFHKEKIHKETMAPAPFLPRETLVLNS